MRAPRHVPAAAEDLKDKAWGLAVEALYLPHMERCSTLMTQYEAFRHPAKTAVYFFAGAQIEFVKKLIATSKREWKKHRHPREIILTLLLENAPPEYLERFLTMYEQIQSWWNANAQLSMSSSSHAIKYHRQLDSTVGGTSTSTLDDDSGSIKSTSTDRSASVVPPPSPSPRRPLSISSA